MKPKGFKVPLHWVLASPTAGTLNEASEDPLSIYQLERVQRWLAGCWLILQVLCHATCVL